MYIYVRVHMVYVGHVITTRPTCRAHASQVAHVSRLRSFEQLAWWKMAEQKLVPSDLYKVVYSFLLENKFAKAAQQFLKQTKVVRSVRLVVVVSKLRRSQCLQEERGLCASHAVHTFPRGVAR